jgi:ribosome-associated translation inhibitor RaiA
MTMQIRIFNKIHNQKLDDYLRRRLELVVGRFEKRIAHIEVHLLDENDSKGGEDKVCTIEVKLIPRGQLHVRAKHEDIYAAAVKAVHRVESVVAKAVDRSHRSSAARHRAGSTAE